VPFRRAQLTKDTSRPLAVLIALALIFSGVVGLSREALASSDIQVSVFNMPGLNGTGCGGENDNLIAIINAIDGYSVDGSIVDFVDTEGQPTLASQLAASRFFFMTDMENQDPGTSAVPTSFLPNSAKDAIRNWTDAGGVMVMTGTHGDRDVRFLNNIYGWNLGNHPHGTATEVTANTAGTPFANATNGVALTQNNATESISAGSVANFTPMWVTPSGHAEVAVIQYGAGYVIYMGWDFYDAGPTCGAKADPWVTGIVPAALRYASELSQSGLENATTSGGDLKYTFSQTGNAYYMVLPEGSEAPTNAEIKAQEDFASVTVSTRGTSPITANVERVFTVTGLSAASDYTAYIVTEYDSSGTPTFSTQQVVNFSTKPGLPSVVSVVPDAGKATVNLTPFGGETNFEYSVDGGSTWIARSPASVNSGWEISGLTNGTQYDFQFRSAFRTLRGDSTGITAVTPSVAPGYLSALALSSGTLSPTFNGQTLSYSVSVENAVDSVTFTPTSTGNSITVAGRNLSSGNPSDAINLSVGSNQITISVLRQVAGAPTTIYTLQVTRQAAAAGGASAGPAPTPAASPRPSPTRRPPAATPITPRPTATPTATPTPTVAAAPTTTPRFIPVVLPERERTPNVVYTPSNPIPADLVEILFTPLAYETSTTTQPALPSLTPTQSVAFENGSAVQAELTVTSNGSGYMLQAGSWQVALEATDTQGAPLVLDDSGNIVLNSNRLVQFQGTGFAPGSIIKVWLFSDPSSIADVVADSGGNFTGSAQLPSDIANGNHTIQLNGLTEDGQVRSVALGVVVQPDLIAPPAMAPVNATPDLNPLLITVGVVMMLLLALIARKRGLQFASGLNQARSTRRFNKALARKKSREGSKETLIIDAVDPFLATQVAGANPSQQFPVDSRRRLGKAGPPRKKQGFPFRKNRPE